jgi:hypothetical protein
MTLSRRPPGGWWLVERLHDPVAGICADDGGGSFRRALAACTAHACLRSDKLCRIEGNIKSLELES